MNFEVFEEEQDDNIEELKYQFNIALDAAMEQMFLKSFNDGNSVLKEIFDEISSLAEENDYPKPKSDNENLGEFIMALVRRRMQSKTSI